MMKIVFDYQIFAMQSFGGVSRYFVGLAQGLTTHGAQVDIVAPIHRNRYLKYLPKAIIHGFSLNSFPRKTARLIMTANHYLSQLKLINSTPDILHETYYSNKSVSNAARGRVVTVYDMIHELYPDHFPSKSATTTSNLKRLALARADHVISISHSTKKNLCELFNFPEDKVSVVHLGFEKFQTKPGLVSGDIQNSRPYLLFVGSRGGYKNFDRMIMAVASKPELINEFDVVAFGGGALNETEKSLIHKLGFDPMAVKQIGGDDEVLGRLYSKARAFVYPSVYEGFGLPPLEAMAHDCPVVTSNSSSMPEVVGLAGEYFDPLDVQAQADAICRVVFDEQRRTALIEAGRERLPMFSWERCAQETQAVYKKVLADKESR
jgi:glycosyltransferase involved in cell wall biosynthesis